MNRGQTQNRALEAAGERGRTVVTMTTLRIGMAQILVEGGQPEANLARAVRQVEEAAAAGCQVVVLPECLDLGWTDPSAHRLAEPIPGARSERLAQAARANRIFVAAGLVERSEQQIFNAAVLLDKAGHICLHHRKINELDIAQDLYATGDRLAVAHTELGVLALNICADNAPDSLAIGQVLARMGAQLLLSPCAWAVTADHDNEQEPYGEMWRNAYGELSRLYHLPVVGVSNVGRLRAGPWQGRKAIGCSLAMGAGGKLLAQGPYGETAEALVVVDMPVRTWNRQRASGATTI
jgi:predicted amidohydrolase